MNPEDMVKCFVFCFVFFFGSKLNRSEQIERALSNDAFKN